MKKVLTLIIAMLIAFACLGGCGQNGTSFMQNMEPNPGYPTQIPEYADDKQVQFVAFWSPPITKEQYTWMKECGITAVIVDNKFDSQSGSTRRYLLEMCNELDIDVYFPLDRNLSGDVISRYADIVEYDSFKGFLCDEPITKRHINNIASMVEAMNALDPDLVMIGNLLSSYSDGGAGYSWLYTDSAEFEADIAAGQFFANYEEYIQYYQDTVIHNHQNVRVSATNYPLKAYDRGYETTLTKTWLKTLGTAKQTANESGVEMWQFIATTAYHSGDKTSFYRQPTEADIRWQTYAALAYGATGIEEFVYTSLGAGAETTKDDYGHVAFTNANDPRTYYKTDVYESAQKVHQEISRFDHVLLSFEWQGVLCHNVSNDPNVTPVFENAIGVIDGHERIRNINSQRDLLIGCFKDENNYDGFLVVNFTETAHNSHLRNQISIEFAHASQAVVYVKGEQQIVTLENNTYSCNLLPGEAVYVIPISQ